MGMPTIWAADIPTFRRKARLEKGENGKDEPCPDWLITVRHKNHARPMARKREKEGKSVTSGQDTDEAKPEQGALKVDNKISPTKGGGTQRRMAKSRQNVKNATS